jgi:hypothetical protein
MIAQRYVCYREEREPITSAAYWIKTVFDACSPDAEKQPAAYFSISRNVIVKLSELASCKGGWEARKYDAHDKPLSRQERVWLVA